MSKPFRGHLVFVGNDGVGKSSLVAKLRDPHFQISSPSFLPPAVEAFVKETEIDGNEVELAIRDTPGDDCYIRLTPYYYTDANVAAICFSVDDPESFEHAERKWLPELYHHRPGIPVILVGCKIDLRTNRIRIEELGEKGERCVSREEGGEMARRIEAKAYIECSVKEEFGLRELLQKVTLNIYSFMKPKLKRNPCEIV
ncbi:P-loop containing nucleoside triphosphate hydrolase protein [Serendipita vermifera]|nr:P-loop containing nucleoside triphosphate hydrolase protein [Serendipita vermifera]